MEDKPNFTKLMKEMKEAFKLNNLILAISIMHPEFFELSEISKYVDLITIQAFEKLRTPLDPTTSHPTDMDLKSRNNILKVVEDIIKAGASAEKLILGLGTTAQTSELSETCEWNLASATNNKGGVAGPFTKASGFLAYYEVCALTWKNHVCTALSPVSAPYGSTAKDFVAYDSEESIAFKIKKIVMAKNLKGVAFWALDYDDFIGEACKNGKYPLVKAAIQTLRNEELKKATCRNKYSCGDAPEGVKPPIDPSRYHRICYFTNWAQYRTNEAKFDITKNFEEGLCSHMMYAFGKVEEKADGKFAIAPYEYNDIKVGYPKVSDFDRNYLRHYFKKSHCVAFLIL